MSPLLILQLITTATARPAPVVTAKPTAAQLRWMAEDVAAIGHFNMGTFEACGIGSSLLEGNRPEIENGSPFLSIPPPDTFAPTNVDTDSWLEALANFGAKHAVLVVSHGCGFNTFPSKTAFPEFGFEYNYTVASSAWKNGTGDIAAEFVASCKKYGIRPGFYHGAMNNAFLNVHSGKVGKTTVPGQAKITQDQYTKILLANLRQLWTSYGDLAEVWFDGGFPPGTADLITDLLQEVQPNAVAFQGPGKNVIRWCGTEGGHVAEPFWSAADSSLKAGAGDPFASTFAPAEADTCFQGGNCDGSVDGPYGGCWFYNSGLCPKSLDQLVSIYHDTVGHNAFLLLDWTPTKTGEMRADHVVRYKEFGSFIRSCYDSSRALATQTNVVVSNSGPRTFKLDLDKPAVVDRISLSEDQTNGQLITGFTVSLSTSSGNQVAIQGQSIGNRFIGLFDAPVEGVTAVVVNITQIAGASDVKLNASLFNCSRTAPAAGCSQQKDFSYKITPEITVLSLKVEGGVGECCSKCDLTTNCAVFVLSPDKTCTLLSANQGGGADKGYVSGQHS